MTIHMHTTPGADPEHHSVQYAALAETAAQPSVDRVLAKLMRVRADVSDPDLKSSDAATTGMLIAEEQALFELATAHARSIEEFDRKLAEFQG